MPHLGPNGSAFLPGYDTFWGTWKVEEPVESSVCKVRAEIQRFAAGSAHAKDPNEDAWSSKSIRFDLAAKTWRRHAYALALPLFQSGDFTYLFFVKRTPDDLGETGADTDNP